MSLNKWIGVFVLIMLMPFFSLAQHSEIGVKGGYSLNRFYYKAQFNAFQENTSGFWAGAVYQYHLPGPVFFSSGILFQRTGSRVNDLTFTDNLGNTLAKGDLRHELDYITLPVTAHFSFGTNEAFSLGAGLFGSCLLTARSRLMNAEVNNGMEEKTSIKESIHGFNFGLTGSAQIRFPLRKNLRLVLSFEEYLGLRDVFKSAGEKGKTNSYGLAAGVMFVLP